jgi:hypothetical protein
MCACKVYSYAICTIVCAQAIRDKDLHSDCELLIVIYWENFTYFTWLLELPLNLLPELLSFWTPELSITLNVDSSVGL